MLSYAGEDYNSESLSLFISNISTTLSLLTQDHKTASYD